ncbi:hypothetical protein RDV89_08620 [Nocardioides zeae]|uniref:DUF1963 domain-containing protein n=1 Tax=Nocardioides imazamoxiresistens TaxID=3231893 RepID=A0ABU3PVC1_9ACTN|nr:hypothetical protein [Nocardioides zeae]MDT9593129.1 hypothetical protein [Nocardioides zeae]
MSVGTLRRRDHPVFGVALTISSYADMTPARARDVARAFDAHPGLRPVKVGGDPARIAVRPSMEAVVEKAGLPVEWLTERRKSSDVSTCEFGQFNLFSGRGGFIGSCDDGQWEFSLLPHQVEHSWNADTVHEPGALEDLAGLFEDLALAMDASYGYVVSNDPQRRPQDLHSDPQTALRGVFWLTYFGTALKTFRPELTALPGAYALPGAGVLIRSGADPWGADSRPGSPLDTAVRELFSPSAFEWARPNEFLPSVQHHLNASPGTEVMPWVGWLAERSEQQTQRAHASAARRLRKALDARPVALELGEDATEWSSSFDRSEWKRFAAMLRRELRGDFAGPIGRAALAVIARAPQEDEDAVILDTDIGVVQLAWFIDDPNTIDIYLWGPPALHEISDTYLRG